MSCNKYAPHIHVLPEDDADQRLANGFILNPLLNNRAVQILPPVGGWTDVVEAVKDIHTVEMRKYQERRVVLLVDFDQQYPQRLDYIKNQIPVDVKDRVFVLGVQSDPEQLNTSLNHKGLEKIGLQLSSECSDNNWELWEHALLRHNKAELDRLIPSVKSFLFE